MNYKLKSLPRQTSPDYVNSGSEKIVHFTEVVNLGLCISFTSVL